MSGLGPDATTDLAGGRRLPPDPDIRAVLEVPVTRAQLAALERRGQGGAIAAVQRIIAEALQD